MNFSTFFVNFESFVALASEFEEFTASPPATEEEAVGFFDLLTNFLVLGFAVVLTVEMEVSLKIPWRRVYSEEPTLLIALRAGGNVSVRVLGFWTETSEARSRENRTACRSTMQGLYLSRDYAAFSCKIIG